MTYCSFTGEELDKECSQCRDCLVAYSCDSCDYLEDIKQQKYEL